jgi:hypothetical protein
MQQFHWPKGTQAELKIYTDDDPQRAPTEEYFENQVRRDINDVRNGVYYNLLLLITSLQNLKGESGKAGFDTWLWAITGVLGAETCKRIGKQVCEEEQFTIEEGECLMENYRRKSAEDLGISPDSTWDKIWKFRSKRKGY